MEARGNLADYLHLGKDESKPGGQSNTNYLLINKYIINNIIKIKFLAWE